MSDQEMETDEAAPPSPIPFQLQFDKPIASQIKIAEWNPEKDLLAMVTEDSKVLLHRFNWQRLWTLSPGKAITSLCWRPDGKAIALGLEDGSISLHDVENAKLLRSIKSHNVAIVCLNWEDDAQVKKDDCSNNITYEDRTMRFFPPPPRVPRMPGLGSGDNGLMDEPEDSFHELSNSSCQRFNILCSGDKDGSICFSIFGIFLIAKINIHQLAIHSSFLVEATYKLVNASIHKVTLSKNLSQLIVLCFGELVEDGINTEAKSQWKYRERAEVDKSLCSGNSSVGLHSLCFSTSIFLNRKNELHQVAQQASSIEDLNEVVRASLSVMTKQWSGAMKSFHDKFDSLSSLIIDHGLDSSSQDEFLSLLFGVRTSPPLHQFLVNSLGELGLKRVSKAVDGVGKELDLIVRESLQPAVEIIGFRVGELRGLSRWRARYQSVGLDEKLMDNATEKAGMLLVQVQRFIRVLAIVIYQFQNFLSWILKCIKILMSEPTDQIPPPNSELVVLFLKFFLGRDPVGQLLEVSDRDIEVDLDTMQRIEELVMFGGFSDSKFMQRSLAKEFNQLEGCFKEAFLMPFTTISKKIYCEDLLPLYPVSSTPTSTFLHAPTSVAYYKAVLDRTSDYPTSRDTLVDYVCFRIPDESLGMSNCIGILKGFANNCNATEKGVTSLGGVLLCIPEEYHCADLSLYKENQIILLLNEANCSQDPGKSLMMMVQTNDLPFVCFPSSAAKNFWKMQELEDSAVDLLLENGKVRYIPHAVTTPLAVSASRGVVCVFSSRKHALVYILDEDEDEVSDME